MEMMLEGVRDMEADKVANEVADMMVDMEDDNVADMVLINGGHER